MPGEEHVTAAESERLSPKFHPSAPHVVRSDELSKQSINDRWNLLQATSEARDSLLDEQTLAQVARYQRNIENLIGTVKIPVGIAGPLRVNGRFALGDYYVPLATTEAALVASYSRGAQLVTEAGGCTAMLQDEAVSRVPGFAFINLFEASLFARWAVDQVATLREIAQSTSRHGKLISLQTTIEGNHAYLRFEYFTAGASGQNMSTIATEAICRYIADHSPVKPRYWFVEANMSGDKKASMRSLMSVRGKRVAADIVIPSPLVEQRLHTTAERMVEYWQMSAVGAVLSGTIGVHGHYANCIAALYMACGQDAACVAESAIGISRLEQNSAGDLYATVTLPNIMVGTVGGGTALPSQHACLEILGLAGPDHARALAEVCAALCLAGELSISGALCAGEFTSAHQRLARGPVARSKSD